MNKCKCKQCVYVNACSDAYTCGWEGCHKFKLNGFATELPCPETDNVNHPSHYETGKFQCIEVMEEALGTEAVKDFCLCNAFKYLYRCNKKHTSPIEDVKKATWYLNKFVELNEKSEVNENE